MLASCQRLNSVVSSNQVPIASTRSAPMSRWRTHGSNGDSQARILDSSSGAVYLKLFAMLIELLLLLKGYDIFSIFTALRVVESEMLMNLRSVTLLSGTEEKWGQSWSLAPKSHANYPITGSEIRYTNFR